MEKRNIGIILIIIGILGLLMISSFRFIGFVVSDSDVSVRESDSVNNSDIKVSSIDDIETYGGETRNININAKNIGKNVLSNCHLIGRGDISNWFFENNSKNIESNALVSFEFELKVPENMNPGDYNGEIEVLCDETTLTEKFQIKVLNGLDFVKINKISGDKNGVNLSYSFDSELFIGDGVSVEIWIVDSDGNEIKRTSDIFKLNKPVISRNVLIKLDDKKTGIFQLYLALSDDLNHFVKQSFVIGDSPVTGFAVLDEPRNKAIGYGIFILVTLGGIFFIVKNYFHDNPSDNLSDSKAGNKRIIDEELSE